MADKLPTLTSTTSNSPSTSTTFDPPTPPHLAHTAFTQIPLATGYQHPKMATNPHPHPHPHYHNIEPKPQSDAMSSLISPPEAKPFESFSRSSPEPSIPQLHKSRPTSLPLSPPVSPETKNTGPDTSLATKDPILYPHQDSTSLQSPLFPEDREAQLLVDEHIRVRQLGQAAPPRRDDYVLALEFKSQVAKMFNKDRRAWQKRERQWLLMDQQARKARYHPIAPTPTKIAGNGVTAGVKEISRPRGRQVTGPRGPTSTANPPTRAPRGPVGNVVAAANGQSQVITTREDKDFNALPDYSPPLDTLSRLRPHSLKIDWKGAPVDLRRDPHRDLLHEDELHVAAVLRLDCATYLTSKRRIFIRRLECLRIGKEFRKTDSQQACKIDVNKASKLWTAFERVGWLKPEHVRHFL